MRITLSSARKMALSALHWWLEELRSMLPEQARLFTQKRQKADILLTSQDITIERVAGGSGEILKEGCPIEALDENGWAELGEIIDSLPARIILTAPEILTLTLSLPAAARQRLRSAIAFQLSQLAPVEPDKLIWNERVNAVTRDRVEVKVTMAKAARLLQIASLFEDRGMAVPAIVGFDEGKAVVLQPGSRGTLGHDHRLNRLTGLVVATLLGSIPVTTIAGTAGLTALTEMQVEAVQLAIQPQLDAERKADIAENLRQAISTVFAQPSATETIEALSLALPDSAYVKELRRDPNGAAGFLVEAKDADAVNNGLAEPEAFNGVAPIDIVPLTNGRIQIRYGRSSS